MNKALRLRLALQVFFVFMLAISIILPVYPAQAENPVPKVSGNTVSVMLPDAYIEATPATLASSGWVEVNFMTFRYEGNVDLVYGFNGYDNVQAVKQEVWEDYEHTLYKTVEIEKEHIYTPEKIISSTPLSRDSFLSKESLPKTELNFSNIGSSDLNSKYADITVEERNPLSNEITKSIKRIAYTSTDGKSYTYNTIDKVNEPYKSTFTDWNVRQEPKTEYVSYMDADKWQTVSHKAVTKSQIQKARIWIDIPFSSSGISGKYNIGLKPSSLTVDQAKSQGKLWVLDPWYNASWNYRKQIIIDQTDDLGTDVAYPMKLLVGKSSSATGEEVDCADHCEADFDDLRFTKSDGTTLLDYWIESVSGSGSSALATVWIETILLDDAADTTIYMYYGNSVASSESNGTNTFLYFNDFDSLDSTNWSKVETGGTVTFANSAVTIDSSGGDAAYVSKNSLYSTKPFIAEVLYNHDSENRNRLYLTTASGSKSPTEFDYGIFGTNQYYWNGFTSYTWNTSSWYILRWTDTSSDYTWSCYDTSYSQQWTKSKGSTVSGTGYMSFSATENTDSDFRLGWLRFRKYTANEPTWGTWGNEETAAPTVTTQAASSVEETTATGNGNITSLNGGGNATARGFEYDTDTGSPYASSAYDSGSYGTGAYTKGLTGLTKGELYYMRAYATNPGGTSYGSEVTFLTKPDAPSGFSAIAGDTKVDLAWTNGTGSQKVMIRYRTDGSYPTDTSDGTQAYFNTGTSYAHTGLTNGTTYKYRGWGYATEGGLTQYSDLYIEATATPVALPAVTTADSSAVEESTATVGGNITSLNGGANCTERGVEYDTDTGSPYASNSHEDGSFGTGAFTINLASLTLGELYYYRAYATNPTGTGYGAEKTFLTKPNIATNFEANPASETQIDLAWTKGTGAQKTVIRAKQNSYPANIADGTEIYNDTGSSYSHSGLSDGEHWYYRAWSYVTEGGLTQYSDTYAGDNAQTQTPMSVTTGICSGSSETWAILNGEIVAADPLPATIVGFDYGLTTSYGSDVTVAGLYNLGDFKAQLSDLSKSTVFHWRAKAYNGTWGYGADNIFSTKGSPALWDYFATTSDNTSKVYGSNWYGQTFTTDNVTARTVTSIIIPLQRTGSSGSVTVSLRNTAGGKPTGVDLCYGTLTESQIPTSVAKCQFVMDKEYSLQMGKQYAIVVRASDGTAAAYVEWQFVNAGGYANGTGLTSANHGVDWAVKTYDYLFELWGNQAIEIQDAKVFQSYKSTGDWLIAVRYVNTFAPYYDTYDVKKYFVLQLVDGDDTVVAQSPLPSWGNRVGNIYLSAAQVSALDYGGNYTLRIYGTFTGNPYVEYPIVSTDWMGDDLSQLDSWVITSASVIGDYYSDLMTTYVSGKGEVLNATGGTIFSTGINGLAVERPDIFQISTSSVNHTETTTSQSYRTTLSNWETAWGEDGTLMITRIANVFDINGGAVGGFFFIIMMFALALLAFPAGHTTAANILSIPCLGIAVYFGLDLVWIIMLALFAAFLLFKNMFMDK